MACSASRRMREVSRCRGAWPLLPGCALLLHTAVASATTAGGGAEPRFLRNVNGVLFFAIYREQSGGWQLWKIDGTENGTMPVIDLNPNGGSAPREFLNVRGTRATSSGG